jgi:hypothetical protein
LFAVAVCLRFAMWFVGAAVLQLIAEFFGGRGSGLGLFAAIGFAHLPLIFMVPLAVAAMLLPSGAAPPAPAALIACSCCADECYPGRHELSAPTCRSADAFMALALAAFAAAVLIGPCAATGVMVWADGFFARWPCIADRVCREPRRRPLCAAPRRPAAWRAGQSRQHGAANIAVGEGAFLSARALSCAGGRSLAYFAARRQLADGTRPVFVDPGQPVC